MRTYSGVLRLAESRNMETFMTVFDQDIPIWYRQRLMPRLEDLHYAIRLRDLPKVRLLATLHADNLNSSLRSATALSLSVFQGATEITQVLLDAGADPNRFSVDWNGRLETPLFSACRLGHFEIAKLLIAYGADVNISDFYHHSPLWVATRERKVDLVELLIVSGAKLDTPDKRSQSPLYLSTKYLGREKIAMLLIQHGCRLNFSDFEGTGALYWSLQNNQLGVFATLVYAGAHISAKVRELLTSDKQMPADAKNNQPFCQWVDTELKNPPPLARLCVRVIRGKLITTGQSRSIIDRIDLLPMPRKLKDLLQMRSFMATQT